MAKNLFNAKARKINKPSVNMFKKKFSLPKLQKLPKKGY